jgi:hypothetical protein
MRNETQCIYYKCFKKFNFYLRTIKFLTEMIPNHLTQN